MPFDGRLALVFSLSLMVAGMPSVDVIRSSGDSAEESPHSDANDQNIDRKITKIYSDILGRAPDEKGLEFYRNQLIDHGKDEDWIRRSLMDSDEYKARLSLGRWKAVLGISLLLLLLFSLWEGDRSAAWIRARFPSFSSISRKLPSMSWLQFCVLCGGFFCIRGIMILSVYPPMEGPDEYQHLAYIEYVGTSHKIPVYGKTKVPQTLLADLIDLPFPYHGWRQTAPAGSLPYSEFFDRASGPYKNFSIGLYQAQHPPLFYLVAAYPYNLVKNHFSLKTLIYGFRCINVLIAAVALVLFLASSRCLFRDERTARTTVFTISLLPNLLLSSCRVANDMLAFLFCSIAFFVLSKISGASLLRIKTVSFLSVMVACGALTKLTVFFVLPASIVIVVMAGFQAGQTLRKTGSAAGLMVAIYLLLAGIFHIFSFHHYGTFFPSYESFSRSPILYPLSDLTWNQHLDIMDQTIIRNTFIRNLWFSGWSFIETDTGLRTLFGYLMAFSLPGWVIGKYRKIRLRNTPQVTGNSCTAAHLVFVFTGLSIILAREYMFYGIHGITTGLPNYSVPVICPLLALSAWSLLGYGSRLFFFAVEILLASTFIITEWFSLFRIAAPVWADTAGWDLILQRLDSVHPGWLNHSVFTWMGPVYILLLVICCLMIVSESGLERHGKHSFQNQ